MIRRRLMKLLLFQAQRFEWKAFSKTLEDAPDAPIDGEAERHSVDEAVVVFFHAEAKDEDEAECKRVFKHTLKHIKWIAGKRGLKRIVLHSFTHLGGVNASPEFAVDFMTSMDERLTNTGYKVAKTPFGYFCEWDLSVYGESLAKVWKDF
ncbi:MAG: threonyl-tRNA synthetase editing domain-containing protein [Planctomycetes bacterium]|nr:threonyl-tRNA synthetase editing domain-containing protein [Planctomycetota bacterium]